MYEVEVVNIYDIDLFNIYDIDLIYMIQIYSKDIAEKYMIQIDLEDIVEEDFMSFRGYNELLRFNMIKEWLFLVKGEYK